MQLESVKSKDQQKQKKSSRNNNKDSMVNAEKVAIVKSKLEKQQLEIQHKERESRMRAADRIAEQILNMENSLPQDK